MDLGENSKREKHPRMRNQGDHEIGLKVNKPVLKGLLTFPGFADDESLVCVCICCRDFEGELIDSPEGVLSWIDNEKLLDARSIGGDRIFLKWLDYPGFLFSQIQL